MIAPFRHAEERVRSAITHMYVEYVRPDRLTVHMHPAVVADIRRDPLYWDWGRVPLDSIFGLPVRADPSLPEHGIVLRYEVVA